MKQKINFSIGNSFRLTFYKLALEEQNQNNSAYA